MGSTTPSQSVNYAKLIEKQDYEKVEKELSKEKSSISSEEEFFHNNFWRAVLLYNVHYAKNDPLKAYNIIINLQKRFIKLTDGDIVKKINKIGIDNGVLTAYTDSACYYGLEKAKKENTLEAYNNYLKYYDLSHPEYREPARERRDAKAYEEAQKENTEESYEEFIVNYPDARQVTEAQQTLEEMGWATACRIHTTRGYALFLSKYPKSKQATEARDSVYETGYRDALQMNNVYGYENYMESYPESPHHNEIEKRRQDRAFDDLTVSGSWSSYITYLTLFPDNKQRVNEALDSLREISIRQKSAKGLMYYIDHSNSAKKKQLTTLLYQWITKDGEKSSMELFEQKYPGIISKVKYQKDLELATEGESLHLRGLEETVKNREQTEKYIKKCGDKDLAFLGLQKLIRFDLKNKDWAGAKKNVKKMSPYMKNNPQLKELEEILNRPDNANIKLEKLDGLSTSEGNEYYPVISTDGKRLYFCGRDRKDNKGGEDVYLSERQANGTWGDPTIFGPLSNFDSNDGIMAVSADGTAIIKFENGVMGVCYKTEKGWQPVQFFPNNINRGTWNCDATFCSDGNTLLFTSIRPSSSAINQTEFYHGSNHYESDIYVSHRDSLGIWSEPLNLGSTINSQYSERSPYMHPDMKTLYFSSDGRGGLGGYDVYKAKRLADTCWTCWSSPENLGKEINTPDDDWTYKISTDGKKAYFSQKETKTNESDIYSVNLPKELMPEKVVTISGKMVDHSGNKVVTHLVWEDLTTKKIVGSAQTDPEDGSYYIVLPLGKMYGIYVEDSTVYPETRHVDLRQAKEARSFEKAFHVTTLKELRSGQAITINNIFFEFNKSELLSYSNPELKRLARLLKKMNLKVEISGHTDNVGSDDVNHKLSLARAESVKAFLEQQGCDGNNITTKGYGKDKPIADNETEEGRAKNRRVEMKVIQ